MNPPNFPNVLFYSPFSLDYIHKLLNQSTDYNESIVTKTTTEILVPLCQNINKLIDDTTINDFFEALNVNPVTFKDFSLSEVKEKFEKKYKIIRWQDMSMLSLKEIQPVFIKHKNAGRVADEYNKKPGAITYYLTSINLPFSMFLNNTPKKMKDVLGAKFILPGNLLCDKYMITKEERDALDKNNKNELVISNIKSPIDYASINVDVFLKHISPIVENIEKRNLTPTIEETSNILYLCKKYSTNIEYIQRIINENSSSIIKEEENNICRQFIFIIEEIKKSLEKIKNPSYTFFPTMQDNTSLPSQTNFSPKFP